MKKRGFNKKRWLGSGLLLGMVAGLVGCGVQMVSLTLEDPRAVALEQNPFLGFDSGRIYADATGDEVWGIESDDCKKVAFSPEKTFKGSNAIQLDWDKTSCDWVGMGIGWNGWAAKDLSNVMATGAIQFYVRSINGETHVPVMVFLLEDYGEKRTASALRAKYLEAYPINEDWKKVQIPLASFPYQKDGVDLTNIKQLVIELQGNGEVIIDELEIVPYKENARTLKTAKPSITPVGNLPIVLFEDKLSNAWGLEKNECRDFNYSTAEKSSGQQSLRLSWTEPACKWMPFGFSWNSWLGVDFTNIPAGAHLECKVKVVEGKASGLQIGFQDYDYRQALVRLEDRYFENGQPSNTWQKVRIPIADFDFAGKGINAANIKNFYATASGSGTLFMDEIRLTQ